VDKSDELNTADELLVKKGETAKKMDASLMRRTETKGGGACQGKDPCVGRGKVGLQVDPRATS
jgi:hypothetical protein